MRERQKECVAPYRGDVGQAGRKGGVELVLVIVVSVPDAIVTRGHQEGIADQAQLLELRGKMGVGMRIVGAKHNIRILRACAMTHKHTRPAQDLDVDALGVVDGDYPVIAPVNAGAVRHGPDLC